MEQPLDPVSKENRAVVVAREGAGLLTLEPSNPIRNAVERVIRFLESLRSRTSFKVKLLLPHLFEEDR